jgi:putative secretion ATPase (PEP-CTERM system associated)
MYEAFYGLTRKPFQLNPDPSFYFGSSPHRRAMAYLEYGLHQNEGFIVITGEVGAGKTTLVRNLFGKLDPAEVVAANLVSTQLGAQDMLRMVAASFGIASANGTKSQLLLAIEAFLTQVANSGKRCLLVVDEAQNLTPDAIEELRMLSNFQLDTHALLQSFLIGQPEFRDLLRRAQMRQLRQRVIAACHVGPMTADEVQGYIEHRLTCAGWKESPLFQPGAYQAVFEATGGIPRRINSVCDRLLLSGFLSEKRIFSREDIEEVAQEMECETLGSAPVDQAGAGIDAAGVRGLVAPDDVCLAPLGIEDATVPEARQILLDLGSDEWTERWDRIEGGMLNIERSMLRLERSIVRIERIHSALSALFGRLSERLGPREEKEDRTA